jgi:cell division protein FtsZ
MTQVENQESEVRARQMEAYRSDLAVENDLRIVACGGAGCNVGEYIAERLPRVPITYLNSDEASLKRARSGKVVQVGRDVTFGKSAIYPEVGEACVERCEGDIRDALDGASMAIVVAGLGGGVGSGAAPYVASLAKSMGIAPFGIVILPFEAEKGRRGVALETLAKMKGVTKNVIAIDNQSLLRLKDVPIDQGFTIVNQGALKVVQGLEDSLRKEFLRQELVDLERSEAAERERTAAQNSGTEKIGETQITAGAS